MTPSASSRWIRFQHGVDDRPTRLPISATESEASFCRTARIFRSMASIFAPIDRTFFYHIHFMAIGIEKSFKYARARPGAAGRKPVRYIAFSDHSLYRSRQ